MTVSLTFRAEDLRHMTIDDHGKSMGYGILIGPVAIWFNDRETLEAFAHKLAAYIESLPAPEAK